MTRYENEKLKTDIKALFICIALLVGIFIVDFIIDSNIWNNGTHNGCGGHWVYQQAVGHKYTTSYLYECDTCGTIYEFSYKR
jgi:hypothetical protein